MAKHISNVGEQLAAIWASVNGSGVVIQFGLSAENLCAEGARVGPADHKNSPGVGVDVSKVTSQVGPVGKGTGANRAGVGCAA